MVPPSDSPVTEAAFKPTVPKYIWAALAILFLGVGAWIGLTKRSLARYRGFIESKYQAQLSLIEREMQSGKDRNYKATLEESLAYEEARDQVRAKIDAALSAPEIFAASWSSDGHHGLDLLKTMPSDYAHIQLLASKTADDSRALYLGKAADGTALLVYECWINSPWKREYRIAFRRSTIDRLLKSQ